MLKITIVDGAIFFKELSKEMYQAISKKFKLEKAITRNQYCIRDENEALYKVLVKLSNEYDIEL